MFQGLISALPIYIERDWRQWTARLLILVLIPSTPFSPVQSHKTRRRKGLSPNLGTKLRNKLFKYRKLLKILGLKILNQEAPS
jgi:hypothetical protein